MCRQRLWFWLPLFLVWCGWPFRAEALDFAYEKAFKLELATIIHARPKYLWGGCSHESTGLDCSGYLFLAARRAGMPVRRTTARRMALGESGWAGRTIPLEAVRELDLCWWTFKPTRPDGHVGAFWKPLQRQAMTQSPRDSHAVSSAKKMGEQVLQVTHASPRRGIVVDRLRGRLKTSLTKVRRLTLGGLK